MRHLILAGLLLVTPAPVLAQFRLPFPNIPNLPDEIPVPPVPGLDDLLREEPPISTALDNAVTEVPLLDDYNPQQIRSMRDLERGDHGSFVLTPGVYEYDAQSYCLKAGTHGPGMGDGYVFAPLAGKRETIIRHILQNSVEHPDIPQSQIQVLIWAILARTRFNDMPSEIQAVARRLLTDGEISRLNGGALGLIPPEVRGRLFAELPSGVRQVLEAEAELRSLLSQGNSSYAELERIAVLVGDVGLGEGSREVPMGRWSYHPDGFFIRYLPSGYSRTKIQISLPDRHTIQRDALGRITAIADQQGNQIETVYDDSVAPRPHPTQPNLEAYAFQTVRFSRPDPTRPGQRQTIEVQNRGWTFAQRQSQVGQRPAMPLITASASLGWLAQADRFERWRERAEQAYEWQQQAEDYRERWERRSRDRSPDDINDLGDLGHYRDGIEAATSGDPAERIDWMGQHQERTTNALEYAICVLEERCSAGSETEYDPSGDVAVPGNTSRQRLGQSARFQ